MMTTEYKRERGEEALGSAFLRVPERSIDDEKECRFKGLT
jgi:hypothetical protein